MADTKVSALTAATTPLAGTELVPIVQGGTSKKVAQSDLAVPADGSITGAKIDSAIKDAAAGTASLRTLGTSSTSAMAGDKNLATIAAPSADVNLNSKKITSLADPTAAQDGATKAYADLKLAATSARSALHMSSSAVDVVPRSQTNTGPTLTAGTCYWTFFTPLFDITVSQMQVYGINAVTSPTLVRFGLYTWDESTTTASLVARTANDTSLLTGTALYTRSFDTAGGYPSSYALTAGTRYAAAIIFVGGSGSPSVQSFSTALGALNALAPRMSGQRASLTDLPTSNNTWTNQTALNWVRFLT